MSTQKHDDAPLTEDDIADGIDTVKRGLAPRAGARGAQGGEEAAVVPDHVVEAAVRAAAAAPVGKANWAAIIQAILAALSAIGPFIPKGENA